VVVCVYDWGAAANAIESKRKDGGYAQDQRAHPK